MASADLATNLLLLLSLSVRLFACPYLCLCASVPRVSVIIRLFICTVVIISTFLINLKQHAFEYNMFVFCLSIVVCPVGLSVCRFDLFYSNISVC